MFPKHAITLDWFCLLLLMAWALPYVSDYIPFYKTNKYIISIAGDLMLIFSFFILGGNFWDKLRSLYVYRSRTILIDYQQKKTIKS